MEALKQERLQKLALYEKANGAGSAWGSRFPASHEEKLSSVDAIRKQFAALDPAKHADAQASALEVNLAARITLRRDQSKKLIFLTLQDQTGSVQAALWNVLLPEETLSLLRDSLDLWDVIGIKGKLAFTQKGEPTVWATSARLLTKCITPPPDKHHGIHDKEIRYRQRYLDLLSTPDSRKTFILRAKAMAMVRRHLDGEGFLEMETPVLQTIPGGAAARPFETRLNALNMKMYLRIATEIPLKKLLVGGLEKVYDLGRIFRNEGIDAKHNPEFTTVELYQAYGDLRDMMRLTENLVSGMAQELTGTTTVAWRGKPVKLGAPWPRLDYCELLMKHAGVAPDDEKGLDEKLRAKKIDPSGLSMVDKIDGVFGEYAEEHLQDACFVINQPVEMSPLCKAHPENPKLADRFEAFAAGMEIANAYTELNDPLEQRKRLESQVSKYLSDDAGKLLMWILPMLDKAEYSSKEQSHVSAFVDLFAQIIERYKRMLSDTVMQGIGNDALQRALRLVPRNYELMRESRNFFEKLEEDKVVGKESQALRQEILRLYRLVIDPSLLIDEDFLCALEYGMPPAGGLGIGIDRVIMLLAGADSIRDVILFPLMRPE